MPDHVSQLSELTGLDDETIKEQILPYLATFDTKQALVNHLQDLLGPGPKQKILIASFADEQFPTVANSKTATSAGDSANVPAVPSHPVSKVGTSRKTKSKFPTKLPPPRKVDGSSFGGIGSVYRKGQEDDSLFAPTASAPGRASPAYLPSPSRADARTPEVQGSANSEVMRAPTSSQLGAISSGASIMEPEYIMIPTDEMKDLQNSIHLLRGDSKEDTSVKAKPCFCQGRRHALHPHVPLCLSCGLILCSILSPSPLLLPSPPCPSCAAPILSNTSRAILLTQLELTLATLSKAHQEKIQLIREERQRAWKEQRKEVELFPELRQQMGSGSSSQGMMGSGSGAASSQGLAYNAFHERRRNLDIAMGRKVEDDSQRRSRVLRIESKSVKKKGTATKKKKEQHQPKKSTEDLASARKDVSKSDGKITSVQDEGTSDDEEEEEEAMIDYSYDDEGDGPIADPDDDGFARHSSVFPPEPVVDTLQNQSWTRDLSYLPSLKYIPVSERSSEAIDEEDEEDNDANGRDKRQVPGSAPKAIEKTPKPSREKGKGKQIARSET